MTPSRGVNLIHNGTSGFHDNATENLKVNSARDLQRICPEEHTTALSNMSQDCSSVSSQLLMMDINPEERSFKEFGEVWIVKSWQEILLRITFVTPIVLLGVIGNLTIIYSMLKFKPFRSKPTNIFILNMAIADLLTTIVCPNAALLTDIYQFYILGPFICRFEGFIKITCLLVSAYSLIVLSFDWFLSVVKPCRRRITIKKTWLTLVAIWVASVGMASPLIHWRRHRERHWQDLVEIWCCELVEYTKYYWLGMTLFLIYIPTVIMTIVLVVILARMDKFEAKLKRSTRYSGASIINGKLDLGVSPPSSTSLASNVTTSGPQLFNRGISRSPHNSLSTTMRYRRRIVKILFLYLTSSIICWTPLQFVFVYRHFRDQAVPAPWFFELTFYAQLCASLSAAMNPIIFGFLSQPFRCIVTKSWMFRVLSKIRAKDTESKIGQGKIIKQIDSPRLNQVHIDGNNPSQPRRSSRLTRGLDSTPKLFIDSDYDQNRIALSTRTTASGALSGVKQISTISGSRHHQRVEVDRSRLTESKYGERSSQLCVSELSHLHRPIKMNELTNSNQKIGNDQISPQDRQVTFNKTDSTVKILNNGFSPTTGRENGAFVSDEIIDVDVN